MVSAAMARSERDTTDTSESTRTFTIRVSDASAANDLAAALSGTELIPERRSGGDLSVRIPPGGELQALVELRFFLRAWQLSHRRIDVALQPAP
jgi:hypothetical protein